MASHDLQEPLRIIACFSQLLEQRNRDKIDKNANDFINFDVEDAIRLQNLINDLLTFSRIGTRGKPFNVTVEKYGLIPTLIKDLLLIFQFPKEK